MSRSMAGPKKATKKVMLAYFERAMARDIIMFEGSKSVRPSNYGWRSKRAAQVAGVRGGVTGYAEVNLYLDDAVERGELEVRENPRPSMDGLEYRVVIKG